MEILRKISEARKSNQEITGSQTEAVFVYSGLLGSMLVKQTGFAGPAVNLLASFTDNQVTNEGKKIFSLDKLNNLIPRLGVKTAILCVPHRQAAGMATLLAECGIVRILNWSGVELPALPDVAVLTETPPYE